jgi:hypothetical protein
VKDARIEIMVTEETKALWLSQAKARDIGLGQFIRNCVNAIIGQPPQLALDEAVCREIEQAVDAAAKGKTTADLDDPEDVPVHEEPQDSGVSVPITATKRPSSTCAFTTRNCRIAGKHVKDCQC